MQFPKTRDAARPKAEAGFTIEYIRRFRKGDDGGGDTPLPIPNREDKPASADGTAGGPRGRVGRRPFLFELAALDFAGRLVSTLRPSGFASQHFSLLLNRHY